VDLELRHCVSEGTLSELDLAHVCKCALGRQQGVLKMAWKKWIPRISSKNRGFLNCKYVLEGGSTKGFLWGFFNMY
jgi:hypothetical protein